jgi:dTMP kinase
MLIAITGIDGSGKTTQIELLKRYLEQAGKKVMVSKAYGELEKKCLAPLFKYWDSLAITFVFQGLHRQQFVDAQKFLKTKTIVLADRWDETFLSFHSKFGFLAKNHKLRSQWNKLAFAGLIPDLTFFIDTPPRITHQRLPGRGTDFFDRGSLKYHEQIRKATLQALKGRPLVIIDGTKTIDEIHDIIISQVAAKL